MFINIKNDFSEYGCIDCVEKGFTTFLPEQQSFIQLAEIKPITKNKPYFCVNKLILFWIKSKNLLI